MSILGFPSHILLCRDLSSVSCTAMKVEREYPQESYDDMSGGKRKTLIAIRESAFRQSKKFTLNLFPSSSSDHSGAHPDSLAKLAL
jgi:hypothetical protein